MFNNKRNLIIIVLFLMVSIADSHGISGHRRHSGASPCCIKIVVDSGCNNRTATFVPQENLYGFASAGARRNVFEPKEKESAVFKYAMALPRLSYKALKTTWDTLSSVYLGIGIFSTTRIVCSFLQPLLLDTRLGLPISVLLKGMNAVSEKAPAQVTKSILWMKNNPWIKKII